MAKRGKKSFDAELLKYLSKKEVARIMAKIDAMVKAKKSPVEIQQAVVKMIATDCVAVLGKALVTGAGIPVHGQPPSVK